MPVVQMDANLLKEMIKGVVREVIQDELLKLKLSLLPLVSDEEMEEINREAGDPNRFNEEEFESLEL